jgi:outer membrane usher protein
MAAAAMERWTLCIVILLCAASAFAGPQEPPPWRPAWVAVEINDTPAMDTIAVMTNDGRLWLDGTFIENSRIVVTADRAPREFLGRLYYAFDELAAPGQLSWSLDAQRQVLRLTADPSALLATHMSAATAAPRSNVAIQAGAFFNYDLASSSVAGNRLDSGLFDLTTFRGPLAFRTIEATVHGDGRDDFIRLDSSLTADFAERRASLRMGDMIASGGQWGQAIRLGGIQWATNFGTQPDLLTLPLAAIGGDATVPSIVDVFVNGSLAASRDVAAGPFSITDLPIVAGSGEVVARVRDAFGREHLISQRFYASPQLLRPGLNDYSFELGKAREGYATPGDRYGEAFMQGAWRRGLLAGTTAELRVQMLEARFVGGVGIVQSIGNFGAIQAATAGSSGNNANGVLAQTGYEYDGRHVSFGALLRWNSSMFRELGDTGSGHERWDVTAHAGWSSPRLGSLSGAMVRREERAETTIASATYARSLGSSAFLSVTVSQHFEANDTLVFASITQLLGRGRITNFGVTAARGASTLSGELRKDSAGAFAYGVQADQGERERISADAQWRASAATISGEIAHRYGVTGTRLQGSGALAFVGGHWAALPHIENTFAIVSVPDMPNLPVYLENRLVAHTDSHGAARLAGLRPYERNHISVDPLNVPLDAHIQQSQLDVVPYGRGGIVVQMDITRPTSVLLRMERESGEPLAAGTRVNVADRSYPVGFDGTIFVPEIAGSVSIAVAGPKPCSARIDAAAARPLPEKTRLVCR